MLCDTAMVLLGFSMMDMHMDLVFCVLYYGNAIWQCVGVEILVSIRIGEQPVFTMNMDAWAQQMRN